MSLNSENSADFCKRCSNRQKITVENALDYHEQIERLQAELRERRQLISQMDKNYLDNLTRIEGDIAKSHEEYAKLKYRHEALLDAFKTQQRVNHTLEDKLLTVVSEMAKRHEALEAKYKLLAANLETANSKIAELTAGNFDDKIMTPDDVNKGAPVSMGFGGGLFPLYHSSPDLCSMLQKQKQRHTVPSKKQTYSPFAIQTFPPTLMCDTSSFTDSLNKQVPDSDGGNDEDFGNTCEAELHNRSRSNTGTYPCGPSSSQMPTSPSPPVFTLVNEHTNDTPPDLRTHRSNVGSVFTV